MEFSVTMSDGITFSTVMRMKSYAGEFFRQPHDAELLGCGPTADIWRRDREYLGDGITNNVIRQVNASSIPEVYRYLPDHVVSINCSMLWLWRNINPELSDEVFFTLCNSNYAWNNRMGLDNRYNCISGDNLGMGNPGFPNPLLCGGAIVKKIREDDVMLYFETIRVDKPLPTAEEVLSKPWLWYWGVAVNPEGQNSFITRSDGSGGRVNVRIPMMTRFEAYVPKKWLDRLPPEFMPPSALWRPDKPQSGTSVLAWIKNSISRLSSKIRSF